eukprot:scaffold211165_cov30-Tisochrysis_lutea.AAC.8
MCPAFESRVRGAKGARPTPLASASLVASSTHCAYRMCRVPQSPQNILPSFPMECMVVQPELNYG